MYRKSIDDIAQLLNNTDVPGAAADRARLDTLGRHESYLALVKERYQNVRANVRYARLDRRGRGRVQVAAELPLTYAISSRSEPSLVKFPAHDYDTANTLSHKRESQLEVRPFLQSIPVYRYLRH